MLGRDVAELLAASPPGATLWVGGLGRSMEPLLRSGDQLKVQRCGETDVRPGHIALVELSGGALIAHVVQASRPLRTASLLGVADPPGGTVLARAVALRRGARELSLGEWARRALWIAQLGARAGRRLLALNG